MLVAVRVSSAADSAHYAGVQREGRAPSPAIDGQHGHVRWRLGIPTLLQQLRGTQPKSFAHQSANPRGCEPTRTHDACRLRYALLFLVSQVG